MNRFVKRKLTFAVVILVLGLCVLASSWLLPQGAGPVGTVAGFGFGWTAIGVLRLLQALGYYRDPQRAAKLETWEKEERTRFIREKSYAMGFYVGIFGCGIGVLLAAYLGDEKLADTLAMVVCGMLIAMLGAWRYFQKKY